MFMMLYRGLWHAQFISLKEYPPAPYSRLSTQYHTDLMLTCCLSLDTKDSSWMSLWLQWSKKFVNRHTGIWIINVLADSHENWAPPKIALGTATCTAQQLNHIYLLVCVAYIVCNVNCKSRTAGSVFCSSEFESTPFSRCIFILKCTGMISKTVFIKPAGTDSTVVSLCWDTYLIICNIDWSKGIKVCFTETSLPDDWSFFAAYVLLMCS